VLDNGAPASLATVTRGHLSSQVNQAGTLGFVAQSDGSAYELVNQASGTLTALPPVGAVIDCGQTLYRVTDSPVLLLCGRTPAYRTMVEGDSGPDVRELNANLVARGYATRSQLDPSSDYFGAETAYALKRLQERFGVDQTGSLSLGAAVFLPGPIRITRVSATLGTTAPAGGSIAQATSTRRQVTINLDASEQASVVVGDRALVTLPNGDTIPGVVTGVGTVASASGGGSASSSSTIPVYVSLSRPAAAGDLDQAPVQVQITTAGVNDALIVPVNALLAVAGGGYALETVNASGTHRLVPVRTGLFDDADGLVQVTGSLSAGERVVVPGP
jgi:peptidoglycan hydrolase-like protein with peptidoglycan-binding domain